MKNILARRIIGIFIAICLVIGMAACSGSESKDTAGNTQATGFGTASKDNQTGSKQSILEIGVWTSEGLGQYNSKPGEDVVEAAIAEKTGVRVTSEINSGQEIGDLQRFNLLYASNSLPELMILPTGNDGIKILEQLEKDDTIYHFTDEELKQKIPDIWNSVPLVTWEVNKRPNGKHAMILESVIGRLGPAIEERYPEWVEKLYYNPNFRNVYLFRDDILKAIIPSAKTQAELEEIYRQTGKLTLEDISIPEFDTMEGFYDYLYKVKEKFGDEVIPWSGEGEIIITALGGTPYAYQDPLDLKVKSNVYGENRERFIKLMEKMNELYKNGLIDKGFGTMKGEEVDQKTALGKYAVTFSWLDTNAVNAPLIQSNKPFRYRKVLVNYWNGGDARLINGYSRLETARASFGYVINKKKVTPENADRILGYLNYFVTDEGMKLVVWGPESAGLWEEKNGKRQWKSQEFKDVILGNIPVGTIKDFVYYGIYAQEQKYYKNYYYKLVQNYDNPYLPTVDAVNVSFDDPFFKALRVKTVGYYDYAFFGWNGSHPTNPTFWSQWGPLNDEIKKMFLSTNKNDFDKTVEAFYDILINKAQFDNLCAQQTKDFTEWQKKYKDMLQFHPDADLSSLN